MKKIRDILIIIIFIGIIFYFPIATKMEPPQTYSFYENRELNPVPQYSQNNFMSGKYFQDWENYFSDQLSKRDEFLQLYILLNMNILKKTVVNNIVIQKNLLLPYQDFERDKKPDYNTDLQKMLKSFEYLNNVVTQNNGKLYYIGIPEQYSYFRNQYPEYLNNNDSMLNIMHKDFLKNLEKYNIEIIDMLEEFKKENMDPKYYSAIDHHYNYLGAYKTYYETIKKINETTSFNLKPIEKDEINFIELPNPYLGSRSRKLFNLYENNEKAVIGKLKQEIPFKRISNGMEIESWLYKLPENETDTITYEIYMGGDIAETIIQTDRPELPNLVLFGDSFTNALETLIYTCFNETKIIDLRYYNNKTLTEYITEYKPDIVICIRDDTSYLSFTGNGDIK